MYKKIKKLYNNNKKIFKTIFKLSPLFIFAFIIIFNMISDKERDRLLTLSSGSPGGAYYPLGGGIAEVVTRSLEDVRLDSEATSGSIENIRLVGNEESQLGMVMESACYKGIEGIYPFSKKYPVKVLFRMYPAPLHIITLAGSNIESIYDLEGKTISIGAPGSGAEEMSRTVLEELSLLDKVNTLNYGQQDAAAALRDGNVDAVFWNFAYPGSAVMEVGARRNLKFISLDGEDMDKIISNNPYFTKEIIPAGTYDKQDEDIDVLSVNNLLIAHEKMSNELAYSIVKAIFNERDRLEEIHNVARYITMDNAIDTSIEIHEGALKFFEENSR